MLVIFLKEIGRLVNLRSLQLSIPHDVEEAVKQAYGIPAEISSLTKLEDLHLIRIGLSGPIPAAISCLKNLRRLNLDNNFLNGPIPAEFTKLSAMRELHLHSNELNGSIPAAISHLTDLSSIRLAHNKLSGSIPAAASALKKLRELTVEGNHDLSGPIPSVLTSLSFETKSEHQFVKTVPGTVGLCCINNDSSDYDLCDS